MKRTRLDIAICALRWVLGIVVLVETLLFLFGAHSGAGHAGGRPVLPDAVRWALGGSEVIAVLLFIIRPTLVFGSWLLLTVFGAAILIHLAHGELNVGGLIVYAAAVVVVLTHHKFTRPESASTL